MKYALAGGTGVLDAVPLPDIYGGSTTTGGEESTMNPFDSIMTASVSSKSTKNKSKKNKNNKMSNNSTVEKQPDIDSVIEKIKLKSGAAPEWTDERLKALVASR